MKIKIEHLSKCDKKGYAITSPACQKCENYISHETILDDHGRVEHHFIDCKIIEKLKVNLFISEHIIVDGYPSLYEITKGKYQDCNAIINVSDEFVLSHSEVMAKKRILSYYFPLGETIDIMGMNSIYGALQVLYQIYTCYPEWKILLHCQAGANRSPMIKAAFHYMMIGEHIEEKTKSGLILKSNMLIWNCEKKHLPEIKTMELFLNKCKEAFDNSYSFFGGMFDWIMEETFK